MPRQNVEYQFPDEKEEEFVTEIELEPSSAEVIDTSGNTPQKQEEPEVEVEAETELEIVDDTPPEDRGRKPSEPPKDVTEEELESYSEKVRQRIKHFSKGYHDERRAKEQALRERQELERITRQLYEKVQQLEGEGTKSRTALLEQAKRAADAELESARKKYREAYEAGDTDAVLAAQEELTSAKWRVEQISRVKPATSLQERETPVQTTQQQPSAQQPTVDQKAQAWQQENTWFGTDEEMTAYALGLHQKLVKNGVDPQSDEYYETINSRMRKTFSEYFGEMEMEDEPPAKGKQTQSKQTNVVAPATRSTAPKKIRLTQTQVSIAKRLGVPLEEYAKQLAAEMRKSNG